MTRKGAVPAIRLERHDASSLAEIIARGVSGVRIGSSRFKTLPTFLIKLNTALRRRTPKIAISTVDRQEAEAAYEYVMIFLHRDAPPVLPFHQIESLLNIQIDLSMVLPGKRGRRPLNEEEITERIRAYERNPSTSPVTDDRTIRRLKERLASEKPVKDSYRRPPLTLLETKILGNFDR